MIYQLTKTSVGLTGQVKWNLILNNNKVSDFQLTPIHESVNFNYTRREDTLNYTHIQNLNRLYKKISSQFFETVVDPKLNTGYPVRNQGTRIETHENSYEMGLKRMPYQRYNKQFSFFCPVWCDDPEELKKIEFRIVVKDIAGTILSTKVIDHSMISDYASQFASEVDLNSDLVYLNFKDFNSWIKGVNVEDGRTQIHNTISVIETLKQQERTMIETDNLILNQFSNNHMVCSQLFNFNFIFDINDILIPQFLNDFVGGVINIYVDVYCDGNQVPLKDIYSNYDFIPKYDIYTNQYTHQNSLDYLKDYACIDGITKNKLAQTTFHWALNENSDYLFNLYDGCAPKFKKQYLKGAYYDVPDLYSNVWDPTKNQLSWLKPKTISTNPLPTQHEIALQLEELFDNPKDPSWYHVKKKDTEKYWINNVLYNNSISWNNQTCSWGSPIIGDDMNTIQPSLLRDMYFNVTFVPNNGVYPSIRDFDINIQSTRFVEFRAEDDYGKPRLYFKNYINTDLNLSRSVSIGVNDIQYATYVMLGKSDDKLTYYNMISFVVFVKENNYMYSDEYNPARYFINNFITRFATIQRDVDSQQTWSITTAGLSNSDSLTLLTALPIRYSSGSYVIDQDKYIDSTEPSPIPSATNTTKQGKVRVFKREIWSQTNANYKMIYNMRSVVRTMIEVLNSIIQPQVIIFDKSISASPVDIPTKEGYGSAARREVEYYNTDKYVYLFRYDGKLQPFFIDAADNELVYNNTYVTKQYNQQINVKDNSDADMVSFNNYTYTKFSPLYPSIDYFPLRKKKCIYNRYHRGSRRYLGEKSWYKTNELYVLPHHIQLSYTGSKLTEKEIKNVFKAHINRILKYNIRKNPSKQKKDTIFDYFIYPLYDHTYTFDYINNKTIGKYIYTIKYTLK